MRTLGLFLCGVFSCLTLVAGESTNSSNYEPPLWVDIVFLLLVSFMHIYYVFKLTDYHLHYLYDENTSRLNLVNTWVKKKKRYYWRFCGCRCKHLTWRRMGVIRKAMRLFMLISCIYAFVLWCGILGNIFIEYLITCIVYYESGSFLGLAVMPMVVFLLITFTNVLYESARVGWQLHADQIGNDAHGQSQQVADFDFFALQTLHANAPPEGIYRAATFKDEQRMTTARVLNDLVPPKRKANPLPPPPSPMTHSGATDSKIILMTPNIKKQKLGSLSPAPNMPASPPPSAIDLVATIPEDVPDIPPNESELLAFGNSVVEDEVEDDSTHAQEFELDYFVGFNWRIAFFWMVIVASMTAYISHPKEQIFWSFFSTMVLRYMTLGALIWSLVFAFSVLVFAFVPRYVTWHFFSGGLDEKGEHTTQPWWHFFLLIDGNDHMERNQPWRNFKVVSIYTIVILGILCIIIGSFVMLDGGFTEFCGWALLLYYVCNLSWSCKPRAFYHLFIGRLPTVQSVNKEKMQMKIKEFMVDHPWILDRKKQHDSQKNIVRKQPLMYISKSAPETGTFMSQRALSDQRNNRTMDRQATLEATKKHKTTGSLLPKANTTEMLMDAMDMALRPSVTSVYDRTSLGDIGENKEIGNVSFAEDPPVIELQISHESGVPLKSALDTEDEAEAGTIAGRAAEQEESGELRTQDTDVLDVDSIVRQITHDEDQGEVFPTQNGDQDQEEDEQKTFCQESDTPKNISAKPEEAGAATTEADEKTDAIDKPPPNVKMVSFAEEKTLAETSIMQLSPPASPREDGSYEMESINLSLTSRATTRRGLYSTAPTAEEESYQQEYVRNMTSRIRSIREQFVLTWVYSEDFNLKSMEEMLLFCEQRLHTWITNYNKYWFYMYKPYNEFDIDTDSDAQHLWGCRWVRPLLEYRLEKTDRAMHVTYNSMLDNLCNIFLTAIVAIMVGGLLIFSTTLVDTTHSDGIVIDRNQTTGQQYAVCSDSWLGDLTVVDLTMWCAIAYEIDYANVTREIQVYFDDNWDILKINQDEPYFIHAKHKTEDLHLVALRGTWSTLDVLQDVSLFTEVALLQLFSFVFGVVTALPNEFIRKIVEYSSMTEGWINSDVRGKYDTPVYDYFGEYIATHDDIGWETTLYFVGHSLGGGIAEIVGTRLYEENYTNIHTFSLNAPGTLLSSGKFGFEIESLDLVSSSVVTRKDLIGAIDVHGGKSQSISCDESSAMKCHSVYTPLCELLSTCGYDMTANESLALCFCDADVSNNWLFNCIDNVKYPGVNL